MERDDFPAPAEGFVVTNFLVVSDQDRSREFYRSIFDGKVVREKDPVIMRVANTWLILNVGGGPTDDKPTVTLSTPSNPDHASAFMNVRVADVSRFDGSTISAERHVAAQVLGAEVGQSRM